MRPVESLRRTWLEMDEEARQRVLVAAVIYGFFLLIGYRSLARTEDDYVRGPRWLWRALLPSNVIKVDSDQLIVVPTGVLAFWLVGRRRKR